MEGRVIAALGRWYRRECLRYQCKLRTALADPAVHQAARDAVPCPTCGAEDEQECLYGLYGSYRGAGPNGEPLPGRHYEGKVHTRRISEYLAQTGTPYPVDVRIRKRTLTMNSRLAPRQNRRPAV